jgi:prevent-host-death family protein
MYTPGMDVAITELRANLSRWIDAARKGDEVLITDRGMPVARIVGLASAPLIDRLTAEGVIARPVSPSKPVAGSGQRPKSKRPVADTVSDQRR